MLLDEQLTNETGVVDDDSTPDYLEAIKTLKQNSVDKAKYEQLKAENKKLLDSIVNGTEVALDISKQEEPSIEELRNKVFNNPNQTNLEYVSNVLKLRERLIEEGNDDPFVASSSQYSPTNADYERANRVATILQDMVDTADGDASVFLNEYQRRVKEVNIPTKKK
ncbi:MAG: hypothetical protein J6T10_11335 [Methanobrevibacter sp.]|nr:hypothetical protein [Methanobrevibacter sp.]